MALPTLQGSEKQLAWAETIRKKQIKSWQLSPDIFDYIEAPLSKIKQASWWIANKDKTAAEIYRVLQGEADNKPPSPSKKAPVGNQSADEIIDFKGAKRIVTDYGYINIFPTRNIKTGKIVNDDTLPF